MTTATRPHPTKTRPPLPPMGPPWWGAVMGTGLLANLTQLQVGSTVIGSIAAKCLLVCAWSLLISFTLSYTGRVLHSLEAWHGAIRGAGAAAWGMVAMGVMSVGSATLAILPSHAAVVADAVLWSLGTAIGVVTTFAFTLGIMQTRLVEPRPAWGLAVVPLMVSATTGAPLVAHLSSRGLAFVMLTILIGCFITSLVLAVLIFTAALHHHARHNRIPVQAAVSAFIPLGPVGQSAAAAHSIAAQSEGFLLADAAPFAATFAHSYAMAMSVIALPLIFFALSTTRRGLAEGMRFSPGWWAMTFPVGTLSLGAYFLGAAVPGYAIASTVIWVILLATWSLCASASLCSWWRA